MKKLELSYTADGNIKWYDCYWKVWQFLKWLHISISYDPAVSLLVMPKTRPLGTRAKLNLRGRVLGEVENNAGLDELQAGIKFTGTNISNLRNADDTTLMAASEELKSLLRRVKEGSEKAGLKLNIKKIMASGAITSWQIDGEKVETDFIFLAPKSLRIMGWLQPWN